MTTTMLTPKLEAVRKLIADPSHWHPWECQDRYGFPVDPRERSAVVFTLGGALRRVEPDGGECWEACRAAAARLGHGDPADTALLWLVNGEEGHAAVLAVLDAAIGAVQGAGIENENGASRTLHGVSGGSMFRGQTKRF